MFLCKVVAGRTYSEKTGGLDQDNVASVLGQGFDSITGETTTFGGSLNYDELVVYRPDAALPSYLIAYKMP